MLDVNIKRVKKGINFVHDKEIAVDVWPIVENIPNKDTVFIRVTIDGHYNISYKMLWNTFCFMDENALFRFLNMLVDRGIKQINRKG